MTVTLSSNLLPSLRIICVHAAKYGEIPPLFSSLRDPIRIRVPAGREFFVAKLERKSPSSSKVPSSRRAMAAHSPVAEGRIAGKFWSVIMRTGREDPPPPPHPPTQHRVFYGAGIAVPVIRVEAFGCCKEGIGILFDDRSGHSIISLVVETSYAFIGYTAGTRSANGRENVCLFQMLSDFPVSVRRNDVRFFRFFLRAGNCRRPRNH
jgi:hypothetical protein